MRRLRLNMYRAEDEMYIIRWTASASASAFAKEAAMEGGGRGVCQAAAEEGGGEEEEEEDEEQVVELFLKQPFDTLERKFPWETDSQGTSTEKGGGGKSNRCKHWGSRFKREERGEWGEWDRGGSRLPTCFQCQVTFAETRPSGDLDTI